MPASEFDLKKFLTPCYNLLYMYSYCFVNDGFITFIFFFVSCKMAYPFWLVDAFVRRSTIGLNTVWMILSFACRQPAFLIYWFHQDYSEKTSTLKNLNIANKSCSEFWISVPVKHHEYLLFKFITALNCSVCVPLMLWASSKITLWNS